MTLKEVVNAKRVSASKMGQLTELALKSMDVRYLHSFCLIKLITVVGPCSIVE